MASAGRSKLDNTEVKGYRMHVSGLAHSVKPHELAQRFASFGEILGGENGVGGLGNDANGSPRDFAFFTISTTEAKLAKCQSILNGSIWKGKTLRISKAKPDYHARMTAEREQAKQDAEKTQKKKKRKLKADPNVGMMAKYFELVSPDNVSRHRGWTLDKSTPTPSPIFPLITRPLHPLSAPPSKKAKVTSWTLETPKQKAQREAKEARRVAMPIRPMLRQKRLRIDPRKWGRQRILFNDVAGSESQGLPRGIPGVVVNGVWECVEASHPEMEDSKEDKDIVTWIFKTRDGTIRRKEIVRLTKRNSEHTDNFTALLENLKGCSTTPTILISQDCEAINRREKGHTVRKDSEHDGDSDVEEQPRRKSLSPPRYIPSVARSLLYNEEDTFALLALSQAEDEAEEARRRECDFQLEILRDTLSLAAEQARTSREEAAHHLGRTKRLPEPEGFKEHEEEDDSDVFQVMRLRGGAGGVTDESEIESESDAEIGEEVSDGSDVSSEVSADADFSNSVARESKRVDSSTTTIEMKSLKSIFTPREAEGSFSLLSGLDLEMEPIERSPSPATQPPTQPMPSFPQPTHSRPQAFSSPPALGRSGRTWIGTGPAMPFFPFPSGVFEMPDGSVNKAEALRLGLDEANISKLEKDCAKRLNEASHNFWRHQSMDQIEANHQVLRNALRGVSRKRHREAVKRVRKAGMSKRRLGEIGPQVAAEPKETDDLC